MATDESEHDQPEELDAQIIRYPGGRIRTLPAIRRSGMPELAETPVRRGGLLGLFPSLQDLRHQDRMIGLYQKHEQITTAERLGNHAEIQGHQDLAGNVQSILDLVDMTVPGTTVGQVAENNGAKAISRMEGRRESMQELLDNKLYNICDEG